MSNPAASLNEMLERVFLQRRDKTVREAWAIEFNVSPAETPALFYLLSKVNQALEDVKSNLLAMPGFDSSIIVDPLTDLGSGICFPNFDTPIGSIAGYYNEQVRIALKIASSYYSKQEIQPHIPEDQLNAIKAEVESLFTFISESGIDQNLRLILLDLVETMRRSVAEFQIRGNQSLQDVLDQSLGRLIRASRQTSVSTAEQPALNRTLALLALIDKALSVAQRVEPYFPILGTLVPSLSTK